jgi:hypothetical protein
LSFCKTLRSFLALVFTPILQKDLPELQKIAIFAALNLYPMLQKNFAPISIRERPVLEA